MAKKEDPFEVVERLRLAEDVDPSLTKSWWWFRNNVKRLYVDQKLKYSDFKADRVPAPKTRKSGLMYMYLYNPKNKKTLKYYDLFPLVIITEINRKHITGLNLHYLSPRPRQQLLNTLRTVTTNEKYDATTRFKISYQYLNSLAKFKLFRPCFKKYIRKRLQTPMLLVPSNEWNVAINLPTEDFKKASIRTVHRDSINRVNGNRAPGT
jgi:hypothetical protein